MRILASVAILAALSTGAGCRIFRIASLTKLMFYPMLERLEAEGRIKMDWQLVERLAKEGRSRYANR